MQESQRKQLNFPPHRDAAERNSKEKESSVTWNNKIKHFWPAQYIETENRNGRRAKLISHIIRKLKERKSSVSQKGIKWFLSKCRILQFFCSSFTGITVNIGGKNPDRSTKNTPKSGWKLNQLKNEFWEVKMMLNLCNVIMLFRDNSALCASTSS